jgi:hypothetical protein
MRVTKIAIVLEMDELASGQKQKKPQFKSRQARHQSSG